MRFTPKQVEWRVNRAKELAHKEYKDKIAELETKVAALDSAASVCFKLGFGIAGLLGFFGLWFQHSYFTNGVLWRFLSAQ